MFAQYTFQHERQHGGDQFFYVPDLEYGPADWDRVHSFSIATTYELPFMKHETGPRRLAVQPEHDHPERPAVQRHLP